MAFIRTRITTCSYRRQVCETCGHHSETDNDFNTLYIEVHGHADLLSSLRAEFKTQGGEAPTGYCCELGC